MLQRGESVTLADGRVVDPGEVLGPPRAGRKVVLTGDTAPPRRSSMLPPVPTCSSTRRRSSPTSASVRARRSHSTAGEAALVAREAGVEAARAHARVDAVLRSSGRRGGDAALPGDGRAPRLRRRRSRSRSEASRSSSLGRPSGSSARRCRRGTRSRTPGSARKAEHAPRALWLRQQSGKTHDVL